MLLSFLKKETLSVPRLSVVALSSVLGEAIERPGSKPLEKSEAGGEQLRPLRPPPQPQVLS